MSALKSAAGGELILLAGGDYGRLSIAKTRTSYTKFADTVTIKSDHFENRARFNSLGLHGVKNLTIDGVIFDYISETGAPEYAQPFTVNGSQNIVIKNSIFDGDVGKAVGPSFNGYPTGIGLRVTETDGFSLENNEIKNFFRGALVDNSTDLKIVGNDVHSMSSDGMNFAAVQNLLIEDNQFHNFAKPDHANQHMDMIQFWTASTSVPTTDVTIRGNILHSGQGSWTQSIFMRNEMVDTRQAGDEMFYRNIVIEDNLIYNAHLHGISVGETEGLTIKNNTLIHNVETWKAGTVSMPTININGNARNVIVENNIIPIKLNVANKKHFHDRNIVVKVIGSNKENHYGNVFVNAIMNSGATLGELQVTPNSVAYGVGASITQFDTTPSEGVKGYLIYEAAVGVGSLTINLDASQIFDANGRRDLSDAIISWTFGDGAKGDGITVSHTYARAGVYQTSATIAFADGKSLTLVKNIQVQ